jgi:hypothetical protein
MEYTSAIINKYSEFALAKPGITNHIKKECTWNFSNNLGFIFNHISCTAKLLISPSVSPLCAKPTP